MKRNSRLSPGRRKVRPKVPDAVREEVKRRTHGHCHLCVWRVAGELPDPAAPVRWAVPGERVVHVARIAHLHHCFPLSKFPELATEPWNLIGLCQPCHFDHESAMQRIPLAALPAETIALAGDDGPRINYLTRTYVGTRPGGIPG